MSKIHELNEWGQSIWFDFIRRSFTESGDLQGLIDQGVRGVTSNPAIFDKAIAGSSDYDEEISRLVAEGKTTAEIYEALVLEDIARAADLFRPLYDESRGGDGYVSLEVSPTLADNTPGTIAEAKRLFAALDRPNILIKIPATPAGIPAIEECISSGLNVNVTLIFSMAQYEAVAEAYIRGLEKLLQDGGDLGSVASVASFFVSRVDGKVDAALEQIGNTDLQGKIAVDNARLAYARFKEIFAGSRWESLSRSGAKVQRPLWASTGTKNQNYRDTLYIDSLIGEYTVNTVPPATLDAFLDHGSVGTTIGEDLGGAQSRMNDLKNAGVDLDSITGTLLEEGVDAFAKAFEDLIESIASKREKLSA